MFTEAEGNDVDLLRKLHIRPTIGHGLGQCNILLRFFLCVNILKKLIGQEKQNIRKKRQNFMPFYHMVHAEN